MDTEKLTDAELEAKIAEKEAYIRRNPYVDSAERGTYGAQTRAGGTEKTKKPST